MKKNNAVPNQNEVDDFKKMMENAERIVLSEEEFDNLQKMLDEPAKPNDKLRELMSRTPPWNKE